MDPVHWYNIEYVQQAVSARILTKTGILTTFLCEFVHSRTKLEREVNICVCSLDEWWVEARMRIPNVNTVSRTDIYNITDVLAELSWPSVHVLVEPWVENGMVWFFTENRYTPVNTSPVGGRNATVTLLFKKGQNLMTDFSLFQCIFYFISCKTLWDIFFKRRYIK